VDSARPRPPALAAPIPSVPEAAASPDAVAPDAVAPDAVAPDAATRLGRVLPLVRRAERTARRIAAVSAGGGVVLTGALAWADVRSGELEPFVALVFLAVVLVPAGLTWLGAAVLRDLAALPARLRTGAAGTAGRARAAVARPPDGARGGRVAGVFRALWAARGLALDARAGGLKVVAAARLLRLASLPFLALLALAFALNFVVIAAAAVALAVVLL
jgi:hypothetical protein